MLVADVIIVLQSVAHHAVLPKHIRASAHQTVVTAGRKCFSPLVIKAPAVFTGCIYRQLCREAPGTTACREHEALERLSGWRSVCSPSAQHRCLQKLEPVKFSIVSSGTS